MMQEQKAIVRETTLTQALRLNTCCYLFESQGFY